MAESNRSSRPTRNRVTPSELAFAVRRVARFLKWLLVTRNCGEESGEEEIESQWEKQEREREREREKENSPPAIRASLDQISRTLRQIQRGISE
jgi:hypothetical protein